MAGILNIQINSLMGSVEANLGKIEYYIKKNADKKLDLVVMPEFFATNIDYVNNAETEDGGETIKFIQELAKKYNTNIIAGSVVREFNERIYNTTDVLAYIKEIDAIIKNKAEKIAASNI